MMDAMISAPQTVYISYGISPVAVKMPAVKMKAPVGIKKQKNKPVVPYTTSITSSRPPYLINASASKMDNILLRTGIKTLTAAMIMIFFLTDALLKLINCVTFVYSLLSYK
jgi:hypothetical protein